MSKKAAKKSTARDAGESGFSTREITDAITKALGELRAERKARSAGWTLGQHLQAASAEAALIFAREKCACSSSSLGFPKRKLSHRVLLKQLAKDE
jgi:hypothetical protein